MLVQVRNINDYFPIYPDIDTSALQITEEGLYSITKPRDAREIMRFMAQIIEEPLSSIVLLDGTANCGGDTIHAATVCRKVISVEKDAETFAVLKQNIEVAYRACFQNVEVVHGDVVQEWTRFHDSVDVLYLDAPWGGPAYKNHASLDLYLGSVRLDTFIRSVLIASIYHKPKYICLKVPYNYNWLRLAHLCRQFPNLRFHQTTISNFKCVILNSI
jgi:predicted RNA methylase